MRSDMVLILISNRISFSVQTLVNEGSYHCKSGSESDADTIFTSKQLRSLCTQSFSTIYQRIVCIVFVMKYDRDLCVTAHES